jgi:hypothetical protein
MQEEVSLALGTRDSRQTDPTRIDNNAGET